MSPETLLVNDASKADIEAVCRNLSHSFQGTLSWKWDRRFETVLAEFGVEQNGSVRAILENYLGFTWDSSDVGNASDIVCTVNANFGGLRTGQLLFTSDPNRDALVFCMWWPWGNGKEISIRIGPSFKDLGDLERAGKVELFRLWFGV